MNDVIEIHNAAKRNVIFSGVLGIATLCVGTLALVWLPATLYLIGILFVCIAMVAFVIAWGKYQQPEHSFILTKSDIVFQQKQGFWKISWHNIQRVDIPVIDLGANKEVLDMIGIKLKDYPSLLEAISPRLMSSILMEQRSLLFYELSTTNDNCSSGKCDATNLLENDYFKSDNGTEYKGIQAMFANRMQRLRLQLGFDLYVSSTDLEYSAEEFVTLLRQCQQQIVLEQ